MTNIEKADALRKVLVLLDGGKAWTKFQSARNAAGIYAPPNSREACRWCVFGAVEKVSHAASTPACLVFDEIEAHPLLNPLESNGTSISKFNDAASWPDVERVLLDTITRLEATC